MEQVLINDGLDFEEVYEHFAGKIRRWAYQYVPGYTYEEVVAEMEQVLWKAWRTWDTDKAGPMRMEARNGGGIGGYFHLLWTHRKADIIEESFRRRRLDVNAIGGGEELSALADSYGLTIDVDGIPLCPLEDVTACKVWKKLAQGYTGVEIRESLRLSKKMWTEIMQVFRADPAVRAALVTVSG